MQENNEIDSTKMQRVELRGGQKNMKSINFMGREYNEKMINVLSDYDKFMSDTLLDKIDDGGYISILEIVDARSKYMDELSDEDKDIIKHFTENTTILLRKNPILGIALDIIGIKVCYLMSMHIKK